MKKKFRIKKNKEIQAVIKSKKSISNSRFVIFYKNRNLKHPRVAVAVNKKFGNAVERNRAKRLVRTVVHNVYSRLIAVDIFILIRKDAKPMNYNDYSEDINYLFKKVYLIERIKKI